MRPRLCLALRTHSPFTMSKTFQPSRSPVETCVMSAPYAEQSPKGAQKLVEPIGIEPMTPCLQSRCSPS